LLGYGKNTGIGILKEGGKEIKVKVARREELGH
jgi:hypothetical protein